MIDTTSATWKTVAAWLEAELAVAREKNDMHMPDEHTIALRARIQVLKDLQQLPGRIQRAADARAAAQASYQAPTFMNERDY
jgi:hypothetical protein